ncbi:MAG: D-alanine--D-alanine ligase [Solidesulfovibrio sp.]|uniref:D-alanine--D-alanine ligase family protein n=1 Tax=Solidesulfovibrio sp. TaxID=2910990 RepID=UPI002B2077B6|nr:D-alanine--D-alanine ligase [Solidesulfovibrio sp.]MEA4858665.1 D-alanine--D-alanine ligase [Solidesulfovibrio sp.]
MKVLLVAGGWSSEREVSLSGARQIATALETLGHDVVPWDFSDDFPGFIQAAKACDFAFLSLHGAPGEDGLPQALLDAAGVPYQGAGPAGSFLALNKAAAKQLFAAAGLATPRWDFLPGPPPAGYAPDFGPPWFVKPNTGGSSVHMSLVRQAAALPAALAKVFATGDAALIEEGIDGTELTCAVLGETALPPILIRPKAGEFFDYASKYEPDAAEEICPAPVPAALTEELMRVSLAAHKALGLCGYSRADFMFDGETLMLLEVNTLPGMTPTSLLPRSARVAGLDFPALVARLMELGLARRAKRP